MAPDQTRTRSEQPDSFAKAGKKEQRKALLNRREYLKMGAAATAIVGGLGLSGTVDAAETAHDIGFERVINAVSDAGMDPNGEISIDDRLESVLASDTLVQFPPGEYLLTDEHILTGVSNVGLQGLGESPSDVRFVFPEGNSGAPDPSDFFAFWIEADSGLLLEKFEIHQTDDQQTGAGIVAVAGDQLELHDIRWQGFNPSTDEATSGCLFPSVTSAEGSGRVANVTIDGGGVVGQYPDRRTGVAVRGVHEGHLTLRSLNVRELGSSAVRASDCPGTVVVADSYFENNDHGNVQIGAGRDGESSVRQCEVVVDAERAQHLPDGERYENVDVFRVTSGQQGWSGLAIEDCEFQVSSLPDDATSQGVITRPPIGDHGGFAVHDSTLQVDTQDCVPVHVAEPGSGAPDTRGVSLENVHITGTQASNDRDSVVYVTDSDDSTVTGCCISFPNGLIGVRVEDSQGCSVTDSDIAVDGSATSFSGSAVETQNLTSAGACRVLDGGDSESNTQPLTMTTDSRGAFHVRSDEEIVSVEGLDDVEYGGVDDDRRGVHAGVVTGESVTVELKPSGLVADKTRGDVQMTLDGESRTSEENMNTPVWPPDEWFESDDTSEDGDSGSTDDETDGTDSSGSTDDGTDSGSDDGSTDDGSSDGSDDTEMLKRIAVRSTGDGVSRFTLGASGSLRAASDADGTGENRTVSDSIDPSSDVVSYYYTGHITEFSIEDAEYAEVYFADPDTGEKLRAVDPEVLDGNALTMLGTGSSTTYDLSVTGAIEPDSDALEDSVSASSASGRVDNEVDTFYFTGDVARLAVQGSGAVTFRE